MINLVDFVNEALGDGLTPKKFKDIWAGKKVEVDADSINPAYFECEIMNVQRNDLPTDKEFENLCKWLVENTSWTREEYVSILTRMIRTFLPTYTIDTVFDGWTYRNVTKHIDKLAKSVATKNDTMQFCLMLFFNMHKINSDEIMTNYAIDLCADLFKPAFEKFGLTWKTWPDYSKGFEMLVKHAQ